jgi:hypothetical protein
VWRGSTFASSPEEVADLRRVGELTDELADLLTSLPWSGIIQPEGQQLLLALEAYQCRFGEIRAEEVRTPDKEPPWKKRPPWLKEQAATHGLALAWEILTGESPQIKRVRMDRHKPGHPEPRNTRFYDALIQLFELFKLNKPSEESLQRWLKETAARRANAPPK